MAPRSPVVLVVELNRDVLLLGAPPVHLGDGADVPLVVWRPEPARQLLARLEVVRQLVGARQQTL